ncbi:MAG: hypothetical protein NT039_02280 [Candidatus Berkelbacteria bacterium]|nr:hypothetical protein [Candidatus Berkelbacteria bacterium]
MEIFVAYVPVETAAKAAKKQRPMFWSAAAVAALTLATMLVDRTPFYYEVPVLLLAYAVFGDLFKQAPYKKLPRNMSTREELVARMTAQPREFLALKILLVVILPLIALVFSGFAITPVWLNVLAGMVFFVKVKRDIEQYEASRAVPPPPPQRLRIYGILRRLELVPAYFPETSGNGAGKEGCLKFFAEMPDNLIRLANNVLRCDGYWDKIPEEVPPADVEGRREFVQYVLAEDAELNAFQASDTDWHVKPTTKTELHALLKQELKTPYYFVLS